MASTYELIETTTLSASASSVTFSSITQDYRDLVLVVSGVVGTGFAQSRFRINGDTGNNYENVRMYAETEPFSTAYTSDYIETNGAFASSTGAGYMISQIMDYSVTDKHKSVLTKTGIGNGSDLLINATASRWANTSAITSLTVGTGSILAGSTFSLYGIAS